MQDAADPKLFHLVFDQFAGGCGLSGWRPASFVARAESRRGPQGPYEWVQNVTGNFRHNAYVYWSEADAKYLLWTIGVDVPDVTSCKGVNKYVCSLLVSCVFIRPSVCQSVSQSISPKKPPLPLSPDMNIKNTHQESNTN